MIPKPYIAKWQKFAPWKEFAQVEQDLIISRTLIEIFSDDFLNENLAFRGGTALHKLYLNPAVRYSEDIDLVQIKPGPIKPIIQRIGEVITFFDEDRKTDHRAHGILQFDRQGKFIRTLAKRGAGPKEYLRIGWTVDEDSQILYLSDVQKNNYLLSFDLVTGEYIGDIKKAIPITSSEVLLNGANSLMIIPSGTFNVGAEPFYYYEQNKQGALLNQCNAPEGWFNRYVENTALTYGRNIWYQNRKTEILSKAIKNQLYPFLIFDYGKNMPESGLEGDMSFDLDFEIGNKIFFHIFTVTGTAERDNSFISYGENTNYIFDPEEGRVSYHNLLYLNPTHHIVDAHERAFNVQSNGVLFYIYSALDLLDQVEKALEDEEFKEPYRSKLLEISNKISEESNPILLVGNILKIP